MNECDYKLFYTGTRSPRRAGIDSGSLSVAFEVKQVRSVRLD